MTEIQEKVAEKGKRNFILNLLNAKGDKDAIAAWKQDLDRVLRVFNVRQVGSVWHSLTETFQTELAINTHVMVAGIYQEVIQGGGHRQYHLVSATSSPLTKECQPSHPSPKTGQR